MPLACGLGCVFIERESPSARKEGFRLGCYEPSPITHQETWGCTGMEVMHGVWEAKPGWNLDAPACWGIPYMKVSSPGRFSPSHLVVINQKTLVSASLDFSDGHMRKWNASLHWSWQGLCFSVYLESEWASSEDWQSHLLQVSLFGLLYFNKKIMFTSLML